MNGLNNSIWNLGRRDLFDEVVDGDNSPNMIFNT